MGDRIAPGSSTLRYPAGGARSGEASRPRGAPYSHRQCGRCSSARRAGLSRRSADASGRRPPPDRTGTRATQADHLLSQGPPRLLGRSGRPFVRAPCPSRRDQRDTRSEPGRDPAGSSETRPVRRCYHLRRPSSNAFPHRRPGAAAQKAFLGRCRDPPASGLRPAQQSECGAGRQSLRCRTCPSILPFSRPRLGGPEPAAPR